jgi:hypothetical protein
VQAGNITFEDCRWWNCRDDAIEADSGGNVTLRNCFLENIYSWISATGNQASKVIRVENTLCRYEAWKETAAGDTQIGPVFKAAGGSWIFQNVTLCIPNSWPETGYNRTRGILSRMSTDNCTLLVYGGQLSNSNGLRTAFQSAGWNIIEGTNAANTEWEARKAAFLAGDTVIDPPPPPPPPPAPSLTASASIVVQVGS